MSKLWLSVYLPSLLIGAGQQAVLVLLPLYALQLGGGAGFAATLLALRGFGSLVSNIPAGMLVSRYGDLWIMLGAIVTLGFASVLLGQISSLPGVGLLAAMFGAGSGAWLLARVVYISEAAPLAQRGRALAGLGAVQRIGMLVGPVVGGMLVTAHGYALAFGVTGACAFAAGLLVLSFTRPGRRADVDLQRGPGLGAVGAIIRDHRHTFATAGLASVGLTVLRSGRQLLFPLFGAAVGLNEAQVGLVFMLSSAVDIAMAYPAGALLDRWGHKAAGIPCFALLSLGLLLLPLVEGFWSLVGVALIAGLGNGLGSGILMTMGADYSPVQRRGEFLGVWRMLGDSGQVGGPVLIGAVAGALTLAAASTATALVGLAGLGIMAFLVRPSVRE